jgi:hypothetical protein
MLALPAEELSMMQAMRRACAVGMLLVACAGEASGGKQAASPIADVPPPGPDAMKNDAEPDAVAAEALRDAAADPTAPERDAAPQLARGTAAIDPGAPAAIAYALTVFDSAFSEPQVAASAGRFHAVFTANAWHSLYYAECEGPCDAAEHFTMVELAIGPGLAGLVLAHPRLLVSPEGAVHVLFQATPEGSAEHRVFYAFCTGDCTEPGRFSTLELTVILGNVGLTSRSSPFVRDATGRLTFLAGDELDASGPRIIASCAEDCTELTRWTAGLLGNGGSDFALASGWGALHLAHFSPAAEGIVYATCAADCDDPGRWVRARQVLPGSPQHDVDLQVTDSGRVLIAYNQGQTRRDSFRDAQSTDGELRLWQCSADCEKAGAFRGLSLGAPQEGERGVALLPHGDTLTLLSAGDLLRLYQCDVGCDDASAFGQYVLDTDEAIGASADPAAASPCPDSVVRASFVPAQPAGAFSADGQLLVTHVPSRSLACAARSNGAENTPATTHTLPGLGRWIYMP